MGIENPVHLLFIAIVALIVLGPKRLPALARALGKGVREFRDAIGQGESSSVPEPAPEQAVDVPAPAPEQAVDVPAPAPEQAHAVDPPEPVRSPDASDRGPL